MQSSKREKKRLSKSWKTPRFLDLVYTRPTRSRYFHFQSQRQTRHDVLIRLWSSQKAVAASLFLSYVRFPRWVGEIPRNYSETKVAASRQRPQITPATLSARNEIHTSRTEFAAPSSDISSVFTTALGIIHRCACFLLRPRDAGQNYVVNAFSSLLSFFFFFLQVASLVGLGREEALEDYRRIFEPWEKLFFLTRRPLYFHCSLFWILLSAFPREVNE